MVKQWNEIPHILVSGDFNFKEIDWENEYVRGNHQYHSVLPPPPPPPLLISGGGGVAIGRIVRKWGGGESNFSEAWGGGGGRRGERIFEIFLDLGRGGGGGD